MITVKDLKDQTGTQDRSMLLCENCGAQYSANKSDYSFWMPANQAFTCCEEPLVLVVKSVAYEVIKR
jgi:hypothetical protein